MILRTALGVLLAAHVAIAAGCRPSAPPAATPAPPPRSSSRPEVRLRISPPEPGVGDTVEVRVVLDGGTSVFSVPFHLTFDPTVLRWDAASEGPWLRSDGGPTTFLSALASPGRVVIGISRLGGVGGLTGGGEICTLRFTALAVGDARLSFDHAGIVDARGETVEGSFEAAPLRVRSGL